MAETMKAALPETGQHTTFGPNSTKPAINEGTQALEDFLRVVGESTGNLNTIAVGLAAIGPDQKKPDGLDISWKPSDPIIAARKARKFAVHAAMVVTVEALSQYVRAITKLPRFKALTTTWTTAKSTVSLADRVSQVARQLFISADKPVDGMSYGTQYRTCCVQLMVHWRNRHVHTDSSATLTHQEKQIVRNSEDHIREKYAGLSVDQLFADFNHNRPTLKEVTTLIAMTIQEVRAIDQALYICHDAADVQTWLDHYKLTERINKIKRETAPTKQHESIIRMLKTYSPRLVVWYEKFASDLNVTISQPPISCNSSN